MTGNSPRVLIVGLGPGDPDLRTVGTQRALDSADRIILRTRVHPGLDDLAADPRVTDCDDLYEVADQFDGIYRAIANRVLDAARTGGTAVFAVPGHPRFGERSVSMLEVEARARGVPIKTLNGVSFVDAAIDLLNIDPVAQGLQIVDAEQLAATLDRDPFASGLIGVDPARPLLVAQLYNAELAAAVKIALSRIYPDEHEVSLVHAAGVSPNERVEPIALHALDRHPVDHLTSLWVPPLASLDAARTVASLHRIVARLRAPDGCPWDRKQTHASLRDAVLAEAYEVVDAIDANDRAELAEELGDLLLLIAMHAQIAEEEGAFRIEDVYESINRKLIRRHPHVFADVTAETADAVVATWESVKAAEREEKGTPHAELNPVDRLPRAMPAMRKAISILAPRTQLHAAAEPDAGERVLATILDLLEQRIDPERALETALRHFAARQPVHGPLATTASSRSEFGSNEP
jgi:tetrapyrrole methylase family protein/MazG family protein